MTQPVLINGEWIDSAATSTFKAVNPRTTEELPDEYPVSPWPEIEDAVKAAIRSGIRTGDVAQGAPSVGTREMGNAITRSLT